MEHRRTAHSAQGTAHRATNERTQLLPMTSRGVQRDFQMQTVFGGAGLRLQARGELLCHMYEVTILIIRDRPLQCAPNITLFSPYLGGWLALLFLASLSAKGCCCCGRRRPARTATAEAGKTSHIAAWRLSFGTARFTACANACTSKHRNSSIIHAQQCFIHTAEKKITELTLLLVLSSGPAQDV